MLPMMLTATNHVTNGAGNVLTYVTSTYSLVVFVEKILKVAEPVVITGPAGDGPMLQ